MRRKLGIAGGALLTLVVAATAAAAAAAWKTQPSPNPTGAMYSSLLGVVCPSPGVCTAVGQSTQDFNVYSTLAERWSSGKWSIQPTLTPGGKYGSLNGVSCAGTNACMAVGEYQTAATSSVVLAERFNGKKWAVLHPSSPAGASGSAFHGVSCVSAHACTAAGDYTKGSVERTLIERWNGKAWSIKHTLSPVGANLSYLSAVSCTSHGVCEAVGYYRNTSAVYNTLLERWNGKKWSIQPTPAPTGASYAELDGVSCTSPGACTAVGDYQKTAGKSRTLAERWNGKHWVIQHTLNPTTDPNKFLLGVSCTSASTCTAAGYTSGPVVWQATLVEQWNGRKWGVQSSRDPGTDNQLDAASCSSTSTCTAVGWYENGSGPQNTLVEHR